MSQLSCLARSRNSGPLNVLDDRVAPRITSEDLLSQSLHLIRRIHILCHLEVVPGFQRVLYGALVGALGHFTVCICGSGALVVGGGVVGGGGSGCDSIGAEDLVDCVLDLANEGQVVGLDEVVACANQAVSSAESACLFGPSIFPGMMAGVTLSLNSGGAIAVQILRPEMVWFLAHGTHCWLSRWSALTPAQFLDPCDFSRRRIRPLRASTAYEQIESDDWSPGKAFSSFQESGVGPLPTAIIPQDSPVVTGILQLYTDFTGPYFQSMLQPRSTFPPSTFPFPNLN